MRGTDEEVEGEQGHLMEMRGVGQNSGLVSIGYEADNSHGLASLTGWLREHPTIGVVMMVGCLLVIGSVAVQGFLSRSDVDSLLILSSFLCIASIGQTLVVVLGGIDLSIPGTVGLGEVMTTVLSGNHFPFIAIVALLLGSGVVVGICNGGISAVFRLHPLIVSLGMSFVVTGGVLVWTSGGAAQGSAPPALTSMVSAFSKIGPLPVPPLVGVCAGFVLLAYVLQRRTRLGKEIYALGSNASAAALALSRRRWVWIAAFVISAWTAEAAGMFLGGFSGGADFGVGSDYLFLSIAAVVVGGTSLLGGDGGVGRTVWGSVTVLLLTTILVGLGITPSLQETLLGVFIIVVVALTSREPSIRSRV